MEEQSKWSRKKGEEKCGDEEREGVKENRFTGFELITPTLAVSK